MIKRVSRKALSFLLSLNMHRYSEDSHRKSREVYFKVIAILLSVSLVFLIEGALRLFSFGNSQKLVVQHSNKQYEDFLMVNPYVGEKYFNRLEATSTTNDIFLKHKPENGFRIFVMGSSTVYGYPYDRNPMATRILQRRLEEAYPDKYVEVVNTAITAINSITLKDFIKQILKHEPDAILIYAGHNEYYGAFGIGSNETMSKSAFLRSLNFKIMNLRLAQLMRSGINRISKELNKSGEGNDPKGTLMKRIVQDKDIVYGGDKYNIGIEQFRDNLSYILEQAENKDVPVFLSDLVSNIRDLPPFGDRAGEDLSASSTYQNALRTLANGDVSQAKELFYRAKDFDPVRFRASEEINQIIDSLARQSGVTLIPANKWFSDASFGGLIGNNLLTEHVHPNIEGQFVLADAFYTKIVESKLINAAPDPLTTKTKAYYRRNWGYTSLDSLVGGFKIKQLKSHWPFTPLDVEQSFRDTFQYSGLIDSLAFTILTVPDANVASMHDFLGAYYEDNNQLHLACKEYESLIAFDPYRSSYYNKAANCHLKLNDLHAAEKHLWKSLEYVESFFAYAMLGEIESIKHNFQGAIDAYQSAFEFVDEEEDGEERKLIQAKLAETRQKASKPVGSSAFAYSNYIPHNIVANYNKALSHLNTNPDSSLYYLSLCLEINDCPLVNWQIGNILFQKQDMSVLFYYNKAYDAYCKNAAYLDNLFVANLVNENIAQARAVLQEIVILDPSNSNIPRFEAALK